MAADTGERLASLETKMDTVIGRLDHQDVCIDKLKRQVWQATGAITIVILLANLYKYF